MDKREVLGLVKKFCTSDDFEREFEQFAKEHADVFESSLDYQAGTGEHPMEFFEVYKDYLDRFEKRIEDYICSHGYSSKQFYSDCQEVLENEEIFGENRFFIEALMATSEYDNFFILMQGEMRRYRK